jgi:hypothetical protein
MKPFRTPRRVTLRITAGPSDSHVAFDAMLVLGRGRMQTRSFSGELTPFELELPDDDCTAVVRAREVSETFAVEYSVQAAGEQRLYARSTESVAVLERRGGGIVVGGLPSRSRPGDEPPAVMTPAI